MGAVNGDNPCHSFVECGGNSIQALLMTDDLKHAFSGHFPRDDLQMTFISPRSTEDQLPLLLDTILHQSLGDVAQYIFSQLSRPSVLTAVSDDVDSGVQETSHNASSTSVSVPSSFPSDISLQSPGNRSCLEEPTDSLRTVRGDIFSAKIAPENTPDSTSACIASSSNGFRSLPNSGAIRPCPSSAARQSPAVKHCSTTDDILSSETVPESNVQKTSTASASLPSDTSFQSLPISVDLRRCSETSVPPVAEQLPQVQHCQRTDDVLPVCSTVDRGIVASCLDSSRAVCKSTADDDHCGLKPKQASTSCFRCPNVWSRRVFCKRCHTSVKMESFDCDFSKLPPFTAAFANPIPNLFAFGFEKVITFSKADKNLIVYLQVHRYRQFFLQFKSCVTDSKYV